MSAMGHKRTLECILVMSALPPKADMDQHDSDVRFVPKADFRAAERTSLFDHFVGTADCHAGGRSGHSFRMCL